MIARFLTWSFAAWFAFLPCALFGSTKLLPAPQRVQQEEGTIALPLRIRCDETFRSQADALGKAMDRITEQSCSVISGEPGQEAINLVLATNLPEEGYQLDTREGVVLQASTPTGIAHATASLLQLAEKNTAGQWRLPRVLIEDAPDFSFRCLLVDMGRNPHSPEVLRRVVDMMWLTKANYLQLHLTDDQLFSFPSTAYPKLLSDRAGWTLDDWHRMEAYSQARGVTIIPELEVPGHSSILRNQYPEVFGKTSTELTTLESAFSGVTTLLTEMMDVFQATPYIHIGGDEAHGVKEDLQRDFINRLNRFVNSRGRQTIVWEGPRLGEGKNKVDENVIHMNWRTINFPAADMLKAGYTIINAAWDPLYIVDHYPRTMFTAVCSEECYNLDLQRFKHVNHGFPTFAEPHRIGSTEQVLGFCMPWWEGREENIVPICRQRLNAATARVWNDRGETSFDAFLQRDEKLQTLLDTIRPWKGQEPTAGWPDRKADPTPGNLAHGKPVSVSAGASQPHFGPQRLTNGATNRFDHFLGYPTVPEPLEITIDLGEVRSIGRVDIFEAAVGKSWEKYEVACSTDKRTWKPIGRTEEGARGETNKVSFTCTSCNARYIRLRTDGCQDLTFPSFSRLCEIMVFEE